jgi:hypothetical protein
VNFKLIKIKLILLILSIFYDVVFIDKLWTNPKLLRAYIGLMGIFLISFSGILYFIEKYFFLYENTSLYIIFIIIGIIMFIIGGIRREINISFDVNTSKEYLKSSSNILCLLSDIKQSSAIIEITISYMSLGESIFKNSEGIIQFAYDIWREALIRKSIGSLKLTRKITKKSLSKCSL